MGPATSPVAPLALAAEHLLTNAGLLDERRRKDGIRSHLVDVQVFADGGVCILVPPLTTGTWLTPVELKRALDVAKTHADRLRVYTEPGDAKLQKPVFDVVVGSGLSRAPGAAPTARSRSGISARSATPGRATGRAGPRESGSRAARSPCSRPNQGSSCPRATPTRSRRRTTNSRPAVCGSRMNSLRRVGERWRPSWTSTGTSSRSPEAWTARVSGPSCAGG